MSRERVPDLVRLPFFIHGSSVIDLPYYSGELWEKKGGL